MDFLRRLFGGWGSEPAGEPDAQPESELPSAADVPSGTTDATSGTTDVAWHKVASDAGPSHYRGEVEGVHVATIVKLTHAQANGEPWEWRLEVPTNGQAAGYAKRLKDAKPAVATALGSWQH